MYWGKIEKYSSRKNSWMNFYVKAILWQSHRSRGGKGRMCYKETKDRERL